MSQPSSSEMQFAGRTLRLETGVLAPQTNASVLAQYGETVVLATVVANEPREDADFFPLRVDYEERLYAGGLIKSSRFVKREGRPTDEATVSARLVDHAIRPLFPKDYADEVQLIMTVLSVDQENDAALLGLLAASAALTISDVPWSGPLASVRVGYKDGQFLLNPTFAQVEESEMDLTISCREEKVVAMEAGVSRLPDATVLEAIKYGLTESAPLAKFIQEFADQCGKRKYVYTPKVLPQGLLDDVTKVAEERLREMVVTPLDKVDWVDAYTVLRETVFKAYEGKYTKNDMAAALKELEKGLVRRLILEEGRRPDGRKMDEIRPLSATVGVLPRTHGSALFTRGLTQSLTVATLGSGSLEQLIQNMYGEETKRYIHHYNGLPFSLGEVGRLGSPGRREIGHGMLAEKALVPVIPSEEEFPYTILVVSEIMSQNGSSSMAATCGSTLALMDAGVPIKEPVAGIAVGLVTDAEQEKWTVLTDIAGVEDWNGFMDFKMTGTREAVTAIQMDIKVPGVGLEILEEAMRQSKAARLKVLDMITQVISSPRSELSPYAPRITQIQIKVDQIGAVIGPGGKVIKDIIAKTETTIDVGEDGLVSIASTNPEGAKKAVEMIEALTKEVQAGEVYEGTVKRILDFGVFMEILPNKEGMVHVSELAYDYVENPRDLVKLGDKFKVKVIGIDSEGRINLSKKALETPPAGGDARERPSPRPGGSRPYSSGRTYGSGRPAGGRSGFRTPYHQRPAYRKP